MSGAPLGALPPAGWACSEGGEINNGEPQCKDGEDNAYFKHSQSLEAEDVLRMKVVAKASVPLSKPSLMNHTSSSLSLSGI